MKIISTQLQECEMTDGSKTNVLEVFYKIGKETWRALLKDYNPQDEKEEKRLLKELKAKIKEAFDKR